jgi:hypothetical protein
VDRGPDAADHGTSDAAMPPHKAKTCRRDLLTESIITASMVKKL